MFSLILKRLLHAVPSLIGVVIVTFVLTRALPGDPAAYFAGASATPEAVEEVRKKLGLDQSLPTQFVSYVKALAQGDFGMSLTTGQSVANEIVTRLPASLELSFLGMLGATIVAIPLGVAAATRRDTWVDHLARLLATAGVSLPVFFTGLLFVYLFYFKLGWSPAPMGRLDVYSSAPPTLSGFYLIDSLLAGQGETFMSALKQILLPAMTTGLFVVAPITRMTRAAMLSALSSDYVRTARAMGLSKTTVVYRYALRNAMLPVLTTLGMVFSFMLGANVLIEKVFAWPGIGSYAIESLVASDYAPVQGFVLTMAVLYVLLNLILDILYSVVDPRVRVQS